MTPKDEFGYEIDDDDEDISLPELLEEIEEPEVKKEFPIAVFIILAFLLGAITIYWYDYIEGTYNYDILTAQYDSEIRSLNLANAAIDYNHRVCNQLKTSEIFLRQKEMNITAMCWSDLEYCHYQLVSVLGLKNITKPEALKRIEYTQKQLTTLNRQLEALEKEMGVRK